MYPPEKLKLALKNAGFGGRKVTVRNRPGGLSWSMVVTVRSEDVDIEKVKVIANSFAHVDRCEMSGDTLSGGNTFVSVVRKLKHDEYAVSV